jgi:hypothetical protein
MTPTQQTALSLRRDGKTLDEIGANLGVSRERARQLVFIAKRHDEFNSLYPELVELTTRTKNVLLHAGWTTKKLALNAVHADAILKRPSSGKKALKEVCEWLGIEVPKQRICDKTIRRAISFLEKNGYKVVKL